MSWFREDAVSVRSPAAPANSFVQFGKVEIEQSIGSRFEQQASQYPGHLAIKDRDHAVTYGALNQIANRIARAIVSDGRGTAQAVALMTNNDALTFAAILGILKAGKIVVPLDSSLAKPQANFILEDTGARLILTSDKDLSLAEEWAGSNQVLVNSQRLGSEYSDANLGLDIPASAHAHILYTSGSMAQPTGVLDIHRNVLHHVMRVTNSSHISPMDRMAVLRPPSSSGALLNALSALLNGASLYLVNVKEVGLTGLANWLIDQKITFLHCGATLFRAFAQLLTGRERFPDLRLVKLSSGMVYRADVNLFKRHFPDCILLHVLSSTEALTYRMYFIDKDTEIREPALPVGYPVEDMDVLVVDDEGKDLGFNSIGEIAVRSEFLFQCYWKQPLLTDAAFLPEPSGTGCRTYRTGDLGRMRPDGCLEYIGRKDSQLKIRGYTIQPEEVELALLRTPGIAQGAVLGLPDHQGEARVVAYVVPSGTRTLTVNYIRNFLMEELPDYMIPSAVVILNALPLKSGGKLDRDALPLPGAERPPLTEPYVEPRTPLEMAIVSIWSKTLAIWKIGVKDNFFDLGGDSIQASQVLASINKEFSSAVSISDFFQDPTVEGVAQLLGAKELAAAELHSKIRSSGSRSVDDVDSLPQ
jgi:acyl-CoA synthetase (AMP-forming)/AMP-acid ligase II/acyl carrier protein